MQWVFHLRLQTKQIWALMLMGFNEKQTLDLCVKLNPLNEWLNLGFENPQTLIEAVQHRAQCWKPTEMDSTCLHQHKTADAQNDGSFAEQLLGISKKHSSTLFFVASKVDLALQGCRIGRDKYELPHSESFNLVWVLLECHLRGMQVQTST